MPLFGRLCAYLLALLIFSSYSWSDDLENKDLYYTNNHLSQFMMELSWIQNRLDKKNLGYEAVKNIELELTKIKSQAQTCIQIKNQKIQDLSEMTKLDSENSPSLARHMNLYKQYQAQLKSCQQIVNQSKDLLIDTQQQLIYSKEYIEINNQRPSLLNIYYHFQSLNTVAIKSKTFETVFYDSIEMIKTHQLQIILLVFLGLSIGILIQKLMIRHQLGGQLINDIPYLLPTFIPLSMCYIFMKFLTFDLLVEPKLISVIKYLLMFLSIKWLSLFYLYYFSKIKNPTWFKSTRFRLSIMVNSIIISALLQFYLLNFFESNVRMNVLYFFLSLLFFIYFTTVCIYFILGITDKTYFDSSKFYKLKWYRYIGVTCVILYFMSRIFFISLGFESFSSIQLGLVICLLMYFFKLMSFISQLENNLQLNRLKYFTFLKNIFKYQEQGHLIELTLFRLTISIWLFILLINTILNILGIPEYYLSAYHQLIFENVHLGSLSFIPINFVNALGVFSICLFFGKILAEKIASFPNFSQDIDRQLTVSIIVRYLIFSISVLIAFLIMGFSSLQLSLALGGVGLGLGMSLNTLLADFISGIIILIQKPIHHGDYISIMEKMPMTGYVQKIMLLSTQILVNDQSVVYVPNSFIVRNPFVNHSARDKLSTSFIEVKIKQIDDFVVVRNILQEIVKKNKFVNQKKPNHPIISLVSSPHDYQDKNAYFIVHLYFNIIDQSQKQKIYVKLKKEIMWRLSHYLHEQE